MELCRWFVRGLGIACLALGGISLGVGVVSLAAPAAYAQTVNSIAVQGNQRVEADTIRSYFRAGPDGQLDPLQIDEGVKALFATGLFQDVRPTMQGGRLTITVIENPVINRIAFEGNKKVKDEQLKTEIQSKERGTLLAPDGAGRHCAPGRGLSAQRPLRHSRRAEDHRACQQPRRSRLRDYRRREDRRQGKSTSSAIAPIRRTVSRTSSRPPRRGSSPSCRPATSTIPTGSRPIASCCAASTSSTAISTYESSRRSASTIRALRGFVITFTIEEGEQYRFGTVEVQSTIRGARSRIAALAAADLAGRCLQRRSGREDRRGHDHRGGQARLCLRDGPSARRPAIRKRER